MTDRDYRPEAEALFRRLANRYALEFVDDDDAPMDICWVFPEQPHLSREVVLSLQNHDMLNLQIGNLWAYFFPFPDRAQLFEEIVSAWIEGHGRVAVTGTNSCKLQILDGGEWKTVYDQNGCAWFPWSRPNSYLMNDTPPPA